MADDALECPLRSQIDSMDEDQISGRRGPHRRGCAGRLYDKYYSEVLGYVYHCTLDRTVAEDLTVERLSCRISPPRAIPMATGPFPGMALSYRHQ